MMNYSPYFFGTCIRILYLSVYYARASFNYPDFIYRVNQLSSKVSSQVIAELSLYQLLKSSMGDTITSLIPTMWLYLKLFQLDGRGRNVVRLSVIRLPFSLTCPSDN